MNSIAKSSSRPMVLTIFAFCTAALVTVTGCAPEPVGPSPDGVDLRGSTLGGDFTLTSNTGESVSWSDFDGRYRLMYFGFTSCPDLCPTDIQRIAQGLTQFEQENPELAEKIQPIFITIDPERDSVEVVDEFVNAFHPRLMGLTGSAEDIEAAKKTFGVEATKLEPDETGWYNIRHTTLTYLYAPDGAPLGVIPTDKRAEGVTAELERWIR